MAVVQVRFRNVIDEQENGRMSGRQNSVAQFGFPRFLRRNEATTQIEILDVSGGRSLQKASAFNPFADAFATLLPIYHERDTASYQQRQNHLHDETHHFIRFHRPAAYGL
jgi:hypothetical protein